MGWKHERINKACTESLKGVHAAYILLPCSRPGGVIVYWRRLKAQHAPEAFPGCLQYSARFSSTVNNCRGSAWAARMTAEAQQSLS